MTDWSVMNNFTNWPEGSNAMIPNSVSHHDSAHPIVYFNQFMGMDQMDSNQPAVNHNQNKNQINYGQSPATIPHNITHILNN